MDKEKFGWWRRLRGPTLEIDGREIVPSKETPVSEELKQERARQIAGYISLGFHEAMGLNEDAYRESFPEPFTKPENRFDRILFVDGRVPLSKQFEILEERGKFSTTKYTPPDVEGIKNYTFVPNAPYAIWTYSLDRYWAQNPASVMEHLRTQKRKNGYPVEVGACLNEVLAELIQNPVNFNNFILYAPNSRERPGKSVFLAGMETRNGVLYLNGVAADPKKSYSMCSALTRSSTMGVPEYYHSLRSKNSTFP